MPDAVPLSPTRSTRAIVWLRSRIDRPGFWLSAAAVSAGDFFAPILPTQSLLVAATLLRPTRWRRTATAFVVGGALGGTALAFALQRLGLPLLDAIASDGWQSIRSFLRTHGALGLFLLTALPWPMRSGVVACALGGVPLLHIAAALLAGRAIAFPTLAWLVSRSPHWLERFAAIRRLRAAVHSAEISNLQAHSEFSRKSR